MKYLVDGQKGGIFQLDVAIFAFLKTKRKFYLKSGRGLREVTFSISTVDGFRKKEKGKRKSVFVLICNSKIN